MSALTSLYLPGAVAVWCATAFALATLWGYAQVQRGDAGSLLFARRAYKCFAASVVLMSVVLAFCLLTRDFRVEYVAQYSGLELPTHYQLAAFWAGQKGSFLIWILWGALLGVPLLRSAGRMEATVMSFYTLTVLGLLFILVRENPFVMLAQTPLDGKGLNPLLQDNWMVIHPPIMFVGYAASAIPFAFAMAALWKRDYDEWAARAFPWALGGFLVLGAAILLGGYWAYATLGWGGFWGWDPVENASLIPWLFGAVLIHGLHLERTRKRYRRANYVLATLVYISVLYGTFLTRSGVLADFSVHSFVDLGISGWLVALMAFFGLLSLFLLATRLRHVPTEVNEDPFLSRGTALVLGTIVLLICTVIITIGTSAPLLTGFMKNPGQVGPEWYNRVNLPIALLLAALLTAVPFLTWRGESLQVVLRKLIPSLVAALVLVAVAVAVGVHAPVDLIYLFLAFWALTSNLHKVTQKVRLGGLWASGGYLSHVGVGVMLVGFLASGGYDQSTKVTLEEGKSTQVGEWNVTFKGLKPLTEPREKQSMIVEVARRGGKSFVTYPKLFRNERTGQIMANPHVESFPFQDIYVSPIDFDPGDPAGGAMLDFAKGQEQSVGDLAITFLGFDLNVEGNALEQMAQGGTMTLGARLSVRRGSEPGQEVMTLYRVNQASGDVQAPFANLAGGGRTFVAGINATDGQVRLGFEGVPGMAGASGRGARLSVDLSRKPFIQLVWGGLYVILIGGLFSVVQRSRQVRALDAQAG